MAALARRFKLTFEITVSKLLPAGAAWQAMAGVASNYGFASSSASFAVLTGIGDGLGVGAGHLVFKMGQRAVIRSLNKKRSAESKLEEPSLMSESQSALYLGSAAFCSGTVWQPVVNLLTEAFPGSFSATMTGTGIVCATVFFAGLRGGRVLYGSTGLCPSIAPNSRQNLKTDALLSLSVGGGSGCFVGTDFNLLGNPFRDVLGISSTDTVLMGCGRAGASTALGYLATQTVQNVVLPNGKNYLDVNAFEEQKQTEESSRVETIQPELSTHKVPGTYEVPTLNIVQTS